MPANSFAGSSSTCRPKASIASATTACLLARTAPRRSRGRVNSWVWPRRWPRRRLRSIRRRRSHSPSLARAVAAACSSSRPSRPAANHATIQPRLSSQSGSTPHEHGCHITHPHRQTRFSLVTTRPRRRSTGQLPVSAFHSAIGPESHPHRCKREPETHQRPSSPNRHALTPRVHRQHRDQIAIAPASASAPHLPRVPSLEAFGRRPPCKPNRRDGPSSETLHNRRHRRLGLIWKRPPTEAAGARLAIVKRLLARNIDINARYPNDLTLLMRASGPDEKAPEAQAIKVVSYLLDAGAHIDDRDDRGRTALMIAAEGGHAEIANLLMARGADVSLKDKAGKRAADLTVLSSLRERLTRP